MDNPTLRQLLTRRWPRDTAEMIATTGALLDLGITERSLTAGVAAGLLVRICRGAYIPASVWNAAEPWNRDMLRLNAHALATRSDAVYSHTSAARLHGCWIFNGGPDVHLIQDFAANRTSHRPGVKPHRGKLGEKDTVQLRLGGMQVRATSLERTVLDCARILPFEPAVVIGDSALRRGADAGQLRRLLAESQIVRGSARARRVVDALDARSESAGETRTRVLLSRMNLPMPEAQVVVRTPCGDYRADFAWTQLKLILEFDGRGKYFNYKPTDEALLAERRREKVLTELGWHFLRIEWPDLADGPGLERRIRAAMGRVQSRGPAA